MFIFCKYIIYPDSVNIREWLLRIAAFGAPRASHCRKHLDFPRPIDHFNGATMFGS